MKVMDAITEILKREGISTMFCFPTTPIIESAAAAGIRPVICRQERVGVHMADGCTRVMNGKPAGVFAMQYGPGRGERVCRHRLRLFGLDPGAAASARPSARHGADVAAVQFDPHVCVGHQVGRAGERCPSTSLPAMRRAFNALKNGRSGTGHGRGARRCDDRRVRRHRSTTRRCAGRDRPATRATSTMRPSTLIDARVADDHRGPGRALCGGDATSSSRSPNCSTCPVMTTTDGKSAFPEDHALALGSGGIVYTGQGRITCSRQRRDLRDRHLADEAQHHDPGHARGQADHPRHQRCARPEQGQRHGAADPRRCEARTGAAHRGGEGPARRQAAPHRSAADDRRSSGTNGSGAGKRSCARPNARSVRIS